MAKKLNPATKVKNALSRGPVKFAYKKKDNVDRIAFGTTDLQFVPVDKRPKGERTPSENVITYFDFEKGEWRSCLIENVVGIIK